MNVLVAGASGTLGLATARACAARGHRLRTLSRSRARSAPLAELGADVRCADARRPGALAGVCDGVDAVISALGAPLSLSLRAPRSFFRTDLEANRALLAEARRAGVPRFVYVSVFGGDGYRASRYLRAHEAFAAELGASGLDHAVVVEPTGLFSAIALLARAARFGVVPVIGDGRARTNPIHEQDVAEICAEAAASSEAPARIPAGGPDVFTRRRIAELALEVRGKPPRAPRAPRVPRWLPLGAAAALWPLHPRLGELFGFVARVSTADCVAPALGTRSLAPYLQEAAGLGPAPHEPA